MSAAFTPGPWKLTSISQDTGAIGICKERVMIAEVHNGYAFMDVIQGRRPKEQFANAYLIEAAPELYEALEAAAARCAQYADYIRDVVKADELESHPHLPQLDDEVAKSIAALAKARGETA